MSTTSLTAAEVMDRAAALQNDPDKTDYTYVRMLPYLNMAIDELVEVLEESNSSPSNQTSVIIPLAIGQYMITPMEHPTGPHYPINLVEIQEVLERGNADQSFVRLTRREFTSDFPTSKNLMYWAWEDQIIKFNPKGASEVREIQLRYVGQAIAQASNETAIIGTINSRSYLSFKTAALCSQFIGENENRAGILQAQAEKSLERLVGISNKGRQEMVTRHRPFRAGWKRRGGF